MPPARAPRIMSANLTHDAERSTAFHTTPPTRRGVLLPGPGSRLRWALIVNALIVFLWMGPESLTVWPAALLGTISALLMLTRWSLGRFGGAALTWGQLLVGAVAFGAVVGLGSVLTTALLMLFKNLWHAHAFPDYPLPLIADMLTRAPAWALVGALTGLGVGLVGWGLKRG